MKIPSKKGHFMGEPSLYNEGTRIAAGARGSRHTPLQNKQGSSINDLTPSLVKHQGNSIYPPGGVKYLPRCPPPPVGTSPSFFVRPAAT